MTLLVSPAERKLVLALLCVASFASVFNNLIITPILPDISDDLGVRVAVAGLLVTAYAVVGGVTAIFSGPFIDRLGRKPVVVTGMALLTVATVLSAVAPSFGFLMAARALAGMGVACLTPAVFSAVGDYFSYEERGRAMSWVITANTSASILGVPAGAFLAGALSWRWAFIVMAGLSLVFTALLFAKLPKDRVGAATGSGGMRSVGQVLGVRQTSLALFSNYLSTTYWFVFVTYMGAYFHDEFGVAKWALGGLTMIMGLGVLIGSNVGGRLSDRVGKRPVILWGSILSALFVLLASTAAPHELVAGLFLLLFAAFGGARFASAQAVTTELDPGRRGTVMALNASGQQFGIVTGSLLGGFALSVWGYTALGPVAGGVSLASALIYMLAVDERTLGAGGAQPVSAPPVEVPAQRGL